MRITYFTSVSFAGRRPGGVLTTLGRSRRAVLDTREPDTREPESGAAALTGVQHGSGAGDGLALGQVEEGEPRAATRLAGRRGASRDQSGDQRPGEGRAAPARHALERDAPLHGAGPDVLVLPAREGVDDVGSGRPHIHRGSAVAEGRPGLPVRSERTDPDDPRKGRGPVARRVPLVAR